MTNIYPVYTVKPTTGESYYLATYDTYDYAYEECMIFLKHYCNKEKIPQSSISVNTNSVKTELMVNGKVNMVIYKRYITTKTY